MTTKPMIHLKVSTTPSHASRMRFTPESEFEIGLTNGGSLTYHPPTSPDGASEPVTSREDVVLGVDPE